MIIKDCATNSVIEVHEVEITGDSLGWDIWYIDKDGNPYHDITVEVIKSDRRVKKFIKQLMKFNKSEVCYKFNYIINIK